MKKNLVNNKKAIIEIGHRAYTKGYIASTDGNISVRLDKNRILITPSGISKGFLKTSDLVIVDLQGKIVDGRRKPSIETYTHLQIYKHRIDVISICHMHPPFATAFAVVKAPLNQPVLVEAIISFGNIPIVEYSTPGSVELSNALEPLLNGHNAFLLANHGALTLGKDIFDAYYRMENLEHYAHIMYIAKQLGNPVSLSNDQIKHLEKLRIR